MAVKQLQLLGIVAAALLALAAIVAAQLLLERNPPHAAASPAPAAAPVQRAIPQDPGPISVGILLSHYTATGPSWTTRGPFGYLRATQAIRALDDGDIELYAVIDPGTEQVPEIQQLASRHFDGRIIDGSDPAALGRLDAIVCYFAWNLPDEVQAAMIQAIRGGTGLLIQASAGSYNPGYNENTSTLHAIRNGEWFYRMEASECRVVGDHPLLAGLMDLPDGVITLSVLSGSIGQIQGTPLIEAVDVPPMNRVRTWTTQRDAAGDSPAQDDPPRQFTPYYPLYIAELGRGRIVVCQWEAAGPEFVKRTGGNFHLRCIQWLARRPIDG